MLNQNDMRIGSFYSLNNTYFRLYDFGEIAFFRIKNDIIGKDFQRLERISFDEKWKKKLSPDCSISPMK